MITELTPEQEGKLDQYAEKWLRIGLCCDPIDRSKASEAIDSVYKCAGLEPPKNKIFVASPFDAFVVDYLLHKGSVDADGNVIRKDVKQEELASHSVAWCFGFQDAPILGFYDFFRNETDIDFSSCKIDGLMDAARHCGWFIPYEDVVIVSDRPEFIRLDGQNRLHCDGDAAVAYRDGNKLYFLHGVPVDAKWAVTPSGQISSAEVLAIENLDVRREVMVKVGVERLLGTLNHSVLDVQGDYELLAIDLTPALVGCKFLKMVNPSIGTYHIEGVDPSCDTVVKAINWRRYGGDSSQSWSPQVLT